MRGSDRAESVYTSGLQETGIEVIIGHRPENISGADLVIASSAIPDDNPELVAARAAGIRVFRRKEFLGELTAGKQTVAAWQIDNFRHDRLDPGASRAAANLHRGRRAGRHGNQRRRR